MNISKVYNQHYDIDTSVPLIRTVWSMWYWGASGHLADNTLKPVCCWKQQV